MQSVLSKIRSEYFVQRYSSKIVSKIRSEDLVKRCSARRSVSKILFNDLFQICVSKILFSDETPEAGRLHLGPYGM